MASCQTRRTFWQTSSRLVPRSRWLKHEADDTQGQERKYFDSGDYALSKAGKADDVGNTSIGREHPSPDSIPHLASSGPNGNGLTLQPTQSQGQSGSPVKESSILQRGMSVDEQDNQGFKDELDRRAEAVSPPPVTEGLPIRK